MKHKPAKPADRSESEIEKLVEDNMRLVYFFVDKYAAVYPNDQERMSAAMEGLWQAARFWKPEFTVPFGTYASMRISWLFKRIGMTERRKKRGWGIVHVALDYDDSNCGKEFHEIIADPNGKSPDMAMVSETESEKVFALILKLPPDERFVLERRFGIGNFEEHRLEDIAVKIGKTRERVRQIEKKALNRLKCLYEGRAFTWNHETMTSRGGGQATSASGTKGRRVTRQSWERIKKRLGKDR